MRLPPWAQWTAATGTPTRTPVNRLLDSNLAHQEWLKAALAAAVGQVVPQQHLWRERAKAAEAEMTGFSAAGATGGGAGGGSRGVIGGIAAAAATGEGVGGGG